MGFGSDIVSRVITKYESDTTGAVSGNKKMVASLGKLAAGAGAAVVAFKALEAGLDTLQKNAALSAATVGVNIKGLQSATNGLVEETRLLEFASKAMNGTFKLSQSEMERSLRGALALRKTMGVDLVTALDKVQQSIVEGNIEPLKELGIIIKDVEGDSVEALNAALKELDAQARTLGGDFSLLGDDVERAGTRMDDAKDRMSEALGRIAVALAPVVELFATLVESTADFIDFMTTDFDLGNIGDFLTSDITVGDLKDAGRFLLGIEKLPESLLLETASPIGTGPSTNNPQGFRRARLAEEREARAFSLAIGSTLGRGFGAAGAGAGAGVGEVGGTTRRSGRGGGGIDFSGGVGRTGISFIESEILRSTFAGRRDLSTLTGTGTGFTDADAERATQKGLDLIAKAEEFERSQTSGLIATVLGTPAEIDAQAEALNALSKTFDGFAGAFGAGVGALIDGSKGFAEAFQDALAASLKGMAVEMAIRSLRELAFAASSLAFGNIPAAGAHAKSAALFGAGAIAAGVGASALGSGGGGVSAPANAGAGAAGVGPAAPGDEGGGIGNTQIFILGDDFTGRSARERQSEFREIARGSGITVPGDVIIDG